MSSAVQREPNGHWVAGATGNPKGLNQWTHPRQIVQRRVDLAVAREIGIRPECATSFAEKVADALADPENHLEFLRMALDRVWPSVQKHELQADGGPPAESSASQWDELAKAAGSQLPADTAMAGGESIPVTIEGAD